MTSIPANLPRRYVDHETGHILHVDPITGGVITRKEMVRRKDPRAEYEAWAAQRRADEKLTTDYATAQASIAKAGPIVGAVEPITKQGRGRPKTIFSNTSAAFMPFLTAPDPLPWVADIIHGSICTSAGTSNGKINVKARAVVGALFLTEISTEACQTCEYTLRTAQRIAKAARHAAHGISSYVERQPKLKAELEANIEAKALI